DFLAVGGFSPQKNPRPVLLTYPRFVSNTLIILAVVVHTILAVAALPPWGWEAHMSVAVVYLARLTEGLAPIRTFVDSYRRHPAGIDHRLVIVFKADDWTLQDEARHIFSDFP